MNEQLKITLPFPDSKLNPNKKMHWAQKAKAAKSARTGAYLSAVSQTGDIWLELDYGKDRILPVLITFYKPDNRRRDDDNIIASFKSYRDGIADAIGVDDAFWGVRHRVMPKDEGGGRVEVVIG